MQKGCCDSFQDHWYQQWLYWVAIVSVTLLVTCVPAVRMPLRTPLRMPLRAPARGCSHGYWTAHWIGLNLFVTRTLLPSGVVAQEPTSGSATHCGTYDTARPANHWLSMYTFHLVSSPARSQE